jgi:plastocyanin
VLGWTALLLSALGFLVIPWPGLAAAPVERLVRVEGRRFEYAPAAVAVNVGDRVTLELVAADVVHSLHLDGYDLTVTAEPGQVARLTFVADRPGTFRFRCSTTCGPLHPFMIGQLTVGNNDFFWRAGGLIVLAALAGLWGLRR